MNKRLYLFILPVLAVLTMGASDCTQQESTNKQVQKSAAQAAASTLNFTENVEIENIRRRLELTSKPGQLGFIMLLNEMGQPILYEGVKGKITSSSKRLTPTDRASSAWGGGQNTVVRAEASEDGTFGNSDAYVYYWNVDGAYRQWGGKYLYSDQPMRLRQDPLIINTK